MNRKKIIDTIVSYLRKNGIKEIGFFGSFVRDEMNADSDIDVLVEYSRGTTLLDIVRMKMELCEKVGRNVDLVSKLAVKPRVMKYIQKDLQILYHE